MKYFMAFELAVVLATLCGSTALAQCGSNSIVGVWSWSLGMIEFRPDHAVTTPEIVLADSLQNRGTWKNVGTWTQSGETYTMTGYGDGTLIWTLKLSPDCKQLIGHNQYSKNDIQLGSRYELPSEPAQTADCISCDKSKHLIWDGQSKYPDCICVCENGWKFDENGNCQQSVASQLGPATASQGTLGSSSSMVVDTGQGDTSISQGDRITLSPQQQAELKVACDRLVALIKANMGSINKLGADKLEGFFLVAWDYSHYINETEHISPRPAWIQSNLRLSRCTYICGKLYSGGYSKKAIDIQPASSNLSDQSVQIELDLEEGPVIFEVVNDQTLLAVDTANLRTTSIGKNTFGLIQDQNSGKSFVVAYQYPIQIQPKNSNLASFTLGAGQMVGVGPNNVGPIMPLGQPPGVINNSGYYVSPDGKDILGTTGGSAVNTGITSTSIPESKNYQKGRLLAGPISLPAIRNTPTDIIYLESGRPYIVMGEGVCSLWSDHTDGVDSCFCYAEWRCPGKPQAWGQLELINPSVHLVDLIEKDTEGNPVYNPYHIYEAVVTGEGKTLQAKVSEGGGFDDNNGELRISVYEAVPMQGAEVSGGIDGSTYISPDGKDIYGQTKGPNISGGVAGSVPGFQGNGYGNSQGSASGGCYQDPYTGEIICVDTQGNPTSPVSSQGNSQRTVPGGCYQDPSTGETICVDSTGTPEELFEFKPVGIGTSYMYNNIPFEIDGVNLMVDSSKNQASIDTSGRQAKSVHVLESSAYSLGVSTGVPAGQVNVYYIDGTSDTLDLIMGFNIAEWGYDRPASQQNLRHDKVTPAFSWPDTTGGQKYDGHLFYANLNTDPKKTLDRIELSLDQSAGPIQIQIKAITLEERMG